VIKTVGFGSVIRQGVPALGAAGVLVEEVTGFELNKNTRDRRQDEGLSSAIAIAGADAESRLTPLVEQSSARRAQRRHRGAGPGGRKSCCRQSVASLEHVLQRHCSVDRD
jgi:hypothetical protein